MRIQYNPDDYTTGLGFLRIIFATKGTVWGQVMKSGLFWLVILMHVGFQLLQHYLHFWKETEDYPEELRAQYGGGSKATTTGSSAAGAGADNVGSATAGIDDTTSSRRELQRASLYLWHGLRAEAGYPGIDRLPQVDWRVATVTLSLLVFFLVFYTITEYSRYKDFFGHTVGVSGACMQWAALVKLHLPSSPEGHLHWNATRLVLASMQMMYYAIHGAGVDDREWQVLMARDLLGADEARTLQAYPGNKPWLALTWALVEVQGQLGVAPDDTSTGSHAATDGDEGVHAHGNAARTFGKLSTGAEIAQHLMQHELLERFRKLALALRFHYGQINNGRKLQVPFPYFHLVNMLIVFNLLMIAYAVVPLAAWPIGIIAVATASFTIIGMRSVAIGLSDPFGKDQVDFDLEPFMCDAYDEAIAMLRITRYEPMLTQLPAGVGEGLTIGDPTHTATALRKKWVSAETDLPVDSRIAGISQLKRSVTFASSRMQCSLHQSDDGGLSTPRAEGELAEGSKPRVRSVRFGLGRRRVQTPVAQIAPQPVEQRTTPGERCGNDEVVPIAASAE